MKKQLLPFVMLASMLFAWGLAAAQNRAPKNFAGDCPPAGVALPFIENFDSYANNTMPDCWNDIYVGGNGLQNISVLTVTSAPSMLNVLYVYNFDQTAYAVTPKINADLSACQITFKYATDALQAPLTIGIMTDPNDVSTFVEINTFLSTAASYNSTKFATIAQTKKIKFNAYKGTGQYVAFKYTNNAMYLIGNVVIDIINDCTSPETFRVTDNATNNFTIDFTPAANETQWEVACGEKGFVISENTPLRTATTHPFTITGLTPNLTYDIYLRSVCGSEKGLWTGPVRAKAFDYPTLPYFCDFENADEAGAWFVDNSTYTNQWVIGDAANDDNNGKALYISKSGGTNNDFTGVNTVIYAYRPVELEAGIYDFGFKWRWQAKGIKQFTYNGIITYDMESTNGILKPFLVPITTSLANANAAFISALAASSTSSATAYKNGTVTTPAGWIALSPTVLTNDDNNWQHFERTLTIPSPVRYNLVFFWMTRAQWVYNNGNSDTNRNNSAFVNDTGLGAAIDSVSIKINTQACFAPEELKVSEVSSSTAKITFVSMNATSWTVKVYTTAADNPEMETNGLVATETLFAKTHVIEELNPNTAYYVYVKANCGESWSSCTFSTLCPPVGVPFSEDFNSYTSISYPSSTNSPYVPCWSRIYYGSAAYPFVFGPYFYGETIAGNESKSLALGGSNPEYKSFAVTPAFEPQINTLYMTFRYAIEYGVIEPFKLAIGVMTDPADESSFTGIDTVSISEDNVWKDVTILFDEYTGAGKHIAIQKYKTNNNAGSVYIDDILIDSIKGCISPKEITVSDISPTSADISWRVVGKTLNYRVKITAQPQSSWEDKGDVYDELINGASSTTVGNLKSNTNYYVYVRTDCGDGTYSTKTSYAAFRTHCFPQVNLPIEDDFKSYPLASLPSCWTAVQNPVRNGSAVADYTHTVKEDGGFKDIRERALSLNSSTQIGTMIALPELNVGSLSDIQLSFRGLQTTSINRLITGVISDLNDPSTFVAVDTFQISSVGEWVNDTIDFSSYKGNAKHIAFYLRKGDIIGYNLFIDSLYICEKSVICPNINSVEAEMIDESSANIKWNKVPQASAYEYKISNRDIEPEITDGNIVPLTQTSDTVVNLTGLNPHTACYIYVRSVCSPTSKGYWSKAKTFTTFYAPAEVNEPFNNNAFTLSPNPLKRGDKLTVNYNFSQEERAGLRVEVFNSMGVSVNAFTPDVYPVTINRFDRNGIYIVRIVTGAGKTLYGKVIVQ